MNRMEIPRIIHFIYWDFEGFHRDMPLEWRENIRLWKTLHSNYEIRVWDKGDILSVIDRISPQFRTTFDNYKYDIQRADAARSFILFENGGIYSDLDLRPQGSIEHLITFYEQFSCENYAAESPQSHTISNYLMISSKSSPFWIHVINEMTKSSSRWYFTKHLEIMHTTGPMLLKKCMSDTNMINIIPRELLGATDFCRGAGVDSSGLFMDWTATQTHDRSWNGWDTKLINAISCRFSFIKRLPRHTLGIYMFVLIILTVYLGGMLYRCSRFKRYSMDVSRE